MYGIIRLRIQQHPTKTNEYRQWKKTTTINEYVSPIVSKDAGFLRLSYVSPFFWGGWYLYQNLQRFDCLRSKSPYLLPLRMDNLP